MNIAILLTGNLNYSFCFYIFIIFARNFLKNIFICLLSSFISLFICFCASEYEIVSIFSSRIKQNEVKRDRANQNKQNA